MPRGERTRDENRWEDAFDIGRLESRVEERSAMSELPTGTVTLLFADIEGSTQLVYRLGDG